MDTEFQPKSILKTRSSFYRICSPVHFYHFAEKWGNIFGWLALIFFFFGLYMGLIQAPPNYQMGDSYRIIFIHAPSAWMSMFTYSVMAVAASVGLIWHVKLGDALARASAPIGAVFTFCALLTGSLWGKPTWGTYWIWDARLTSELILLFLYLGYIALCSSIEDRKMATRSAGILAIVGLVNLPIIHYSVEWWYTLHQGSTVTKLGKPSIDIRMLIPLLIMFTAFNFLYLAILLSRVRCELLEQTKRTKWIQEIIND